MHLLSLSPLQPGQKGWKLDPASPSFSAALRPTLHICTGPVWYPPRAQWWEQQSHQLLLSVDHSQGIHLPPGTVPLLLGGQDSVRLPAGFAEHLSSWLYQHALPPLLLRFSLRENQVQLEWTDTHHNIFLQRSLPVSSWHQLTRDLEQQMDSIDLAIRQGQSAVLQESRHTSGLVLGRLLDLFQLPWTGLDPGRLMMVMNCRELLPLPWELLPRELSVIHYLPVEYRYNPPVKPAALLFTSIYDSDLPHAARESGLLAERLSSEWDCEMYSDCHYTDYQARLADTRILHFSGHGRYSGRRGQIQLDHAWHEALLYSAGLELAVFQSCQTGRYGEGIVARTLSQGARQVIATPYVLPDRHRVDFSRIYRCLPGPDPALLFHLYQLLDPLVRFHYRIYRPYHTEI